ncbi:phosphatidylserine decarboxylase family protein [Blattabacterium cuenoti]|uniref:phosphatidylserine decarboxylase family protein n=1 Tax=Blattabacterium cuenoti TaxID=1653831 RepID=UPI00163C369F|nr:phosphatidylserine decarboxylase family protein [Blattabacterium cuenoti]
MIHKEGISFLLYTLIIFLLVIFFSVIFLSKIIRYIIFFLLFIIYMFLILFFRNPNRNLAEKYKKEEIMISPADGKILSINNIFENEFLHKKCIKISIFMSLFNVHVNRYPISGKIVYIKYYTGKYFIAWKDKSSLENEHTSIGIINKYGKKIFLRQIAGFIARRIIFYSKKNFFVKKGEELGFIKFGSRVDIFIPINSKILIKKGEKVIGGITEISIIPK